MLKKNAFWYTTPLSYSAICNGWLGLRRGPTRLRMPVSGSHSSTKGGQERSLIRLWAAGVLLGFLISEASGETTSGPTYLEHPGQVALVESAAGWRYVHFPTNLRLYTFDQDSDNKSACNLGCSSVWPPLVAPDDAKPIGDWTVFMREDGRRQWAYKGRPVYLRYHDSPSRPAGDGVDGLWHFLDP